MAYYNPLNGMVVQGDGPQMPQQNTSVNSLSYGGINNQSVNGAGNFSPWPGQLPVPGPSQFDQNNYAPHVPYLQRPGNMPTAAKGPAAPAVSAGPSGTTPYTPPAGSGGAPVNTQAGPAEINTGIKSGLLPDAVIQTAQNRLGLGNATPMANIPGLNLNPQQTAEMQGNNDNVGSRNLQAQHSELGRDAAYQQAQMALAFQRAQAAASLQGMGTAGGIFENNVNRGLQGSQLQNSLLGALMGGI